MRIERYDEELRRTVIIATGKVLAKEGQSPLTRTVAQGFTRLGFGIGTGSALNKKQERTYQTVPCAVYSNSFTRYLYDIALNLKKNDIVLISGYKHESVYTDQASGEQKKSIEYRLEFLLPLKILKKHLKEVNEEEIPTKDIAFNENDDGCDF